MKKYEKPFIAKVTDMDQELLNEIFLGTCLSPGNSPGRPATCSNPGNSPL